MSVYSPTPRKSSLKKQSKPNLTIGVFSTVEKPSFYKQITIQSCSNNTQQELTVRELQSFSAYKAETSPNEKQPYQTSLARSRNTSSRRRIKPFVPMVSLTETSLERTKQYKQMVRQFRDKLSGEKNKSPQHNPFQNSGNHNTRQQQQQQIYTKQKSVWEQPKRIKAMTLNVDMGSNDSKTKRYRTPPQGYKTQTWAKFTSASNPSANLTNAYQMVAQTMGNEGQRQRIISVISPREKRDFSFTEEDDEQENAEDGRMAYLKGFDANPALLSKEILRLESSAKQKGLSILQIQHRLQLQQREIESLQQRQKNERYRQRTIGENLQKERELLQIKLQRTHMIYEDQSKREGAQIDFIGKYNQELNGLREAIKHMERKKKQQEQIFEERIGMERRLQGELRQTYQQMSEFASEEEDYRKQYRELQLEIEDNYQQMGSLREKREQLQQDLHDAQQALNKTRKEQERQHKLRHDQQSLFHKEQSLKLREQNAQIGQLQSEIELIESSCRRQNQKENTEMVEFLSIVENLQLKFEQLQNELQALQVDAARQLDQKNESTKMVQQQIAQLEGSWQDLTKSTNQITKSHRDVTALKSRLDAAIAAIKEQNDDLERQQLSLTQELEQVAEQSKAQSLQSSSEERQEIAEKRLNSLQRDIEDYEYLVQNLRNAHQDIDLEIEKLQAKLQSFSGGNPSANDEKQESEHLLTEQNDEEHLQQLQEELQSATAEKQLLIEVIQKNQTAMQQQQRQIGELQTLCFDYQEQLTALLEQQKVQKFVNNGHLDNRITELPQKRTQSIRYDRVISFGTQLGGGAFFPSDNNQKIASNQNTSYFQ